MKTITKLSECISESEFKIKVWKNDFEVEKEIWNYPTLEEELRMEICEYLYYEKWSKDFKCEIEDLDIKLSFDSDSSSGTISYTVIVNKIITGRLLLKQKYCFYEETPEEMYDGIIYINTELEDN